MTEDVERGSRKWRKAMLAAIDKAAAETSLFKGSSKTYGLRAIRRFEEVNKRPFDPFDSYHCSIVHGMGVHEKIHFPVRRQYLERNR